MEGGGSRASTRRRARTLSPRGTGASESTEIVSDSPPRRAGPSKSRSSRARARRRGTRGTQGTLGTIDGDGESSSLDSLHVHGREEAEAKAKASLEPEAPGFAPSLPRGSRDEPSPLGVFSNLKRERRERQRRREIRLRGGSLSLPEVRSLGSWYKDLETVEGVALGDYLREGFLLSIDMEMQDGPPSRLTRGLSPQQWSIAELGIILLARGGGFCLNVWVGDFPETSSRYTGLVAASPTSVLSLECYTLRLMESEATELLRGLLWEAEALIVFGAQDLEWFEGSLYWQHAREPWLEEAILNDPRVAFPGVRMPRIFDVGRKRKNLRDPRSLTTIFSSSRGVDTEVAKLWLHSAVVDAGCTLELAFRSSADLGWLTCPVDHEGLRASLVESGLRVTERYREPRGPAGKVRGPFHCELSIGGRTYEGKDPEKERSRKKAELEFVRSLPFRPLPAETFAEFGEVTLYRAPRRSRFVAAPRRGILSARSLDVDRAGPCGGLYLWDRRDGRVVHLSVPWTEEFLTRCQELGLEASLGKEGLHLCGAGKEARVRNSEGRDP